MTCDKGRPAKAKEVECADCFRGGDCLKHTEGLSTEHIRRCMNLLDRLMTEYGDAIKLLYGKNISPKVYDNLHMAEIELARLEKRLIVK